MPELASHHRSNLKDITENILEEFETPMQTNKMSLSQHPKFVGVASKYSTQHGSTLNNSPLNMGKFRNMASNSKSKTIVKNQLNGKEDYSDEGSTVDNLQKQEYLDVLLSKAKTVIKTGYFHLNDNIVLVFRSMEVF